VGFRRFLSRSEPTPLARLAELGRADPHPHPPVPFAPRTTQSDAAPISDVAVDKTAAQSSVAESKKAEPSRRTPSYVWRSQRNRNGIFDMNF
jgi:hypothetical protein